MTVRQCLAVVAKTIDPRMPDAGKEHGSSRTLRVLVGRVPGLVLPCLAILQGYVLEHRVDPNVPRLRNTA